MAATVLQQRCRATLYRDHRGRLAWVLVDVDGGGGDDGDVSSWLCEVYRGYEWLHPVPAERRVPPAAVADAMQRETLTLRDASCSMHKLWPLLDTALQCPTLPATAAGGPGCACELYATLEGAFDDAALSIETRDANWARDLRRRLRSAVNR